MNFLIDAQLPPAICHWFEARGHGATHVTERAGVLADAAIADWAEADNLILVSKDEDFLTLRLPDRLAFLWLRCGNTTNRTLVKWLEARWDKVEQSLKGGERLIELV